MINIISVLQHLRRRERQGEREEDEEEGGRIEWEGRKENEGARGGGWISQMNEQSDWLSTS